MPTASGLISSAKSAPVLLFLYIVRFCIRRPKSIPIKRFSQRKPPSASAPRPMSMMPMRRWRASSSSTRFKAALSLNDFPRRAATGWWFCNTCTLRTICAGMLRLAKAYLLPSKSMPST